MDEKPKKLLDQVRETTRNKHYSLPHPTESRRRDAPTHDLPDAPMIVVSWHFEHLSNSAH